MLLIEDDLGSKTDSQPTFGSRKTILKRQRGFNLKKVQSFEIKEMNPL
jgi:hypothetical protein